MGEEPPRKGLRVCFVSLKDRLQTGVLTLNSQMAAKGEGGHEEFVKPSESRH